MTFLNVTLNHHMELLNTNHHLLFHSRSLVKLNIDRILIILIILTANKWNIVSSDMSCDSLNFINFEFYNVNSIIFYCISLSQIIT